MSETTPKEELVKTQLDIFIQRYGELVKDMQIDFASYPVLVPDGQEGFKLIVQTTPVSIKNQPKASPFVGK